MADDKKDTKEQGAKKAAPAPPTPAKKAAPALVFLRMTHGARRRGPSAWTATPDRVPGLQGRYVLTREGTHVSKADAAFLMSKSQVAVAARQDRVFVVADPPPVAEVPKALELPTEKEAQAALPNTVLGPLRSVGLGARDAIRLSDAQLLAVPGIGAKGLAAIRALYP